MKYQIEPRLTLLSKHVDAGPLLIKSRHVWAALNCTSPVYRTQAILQNVAKIEFQNHT